mmetsp:Transcript_3843/g.8214  ORF Transcript_3843/g.8214 Transcript_3843/m.8214 type:complete len:132 (-) Transcript_3843:55-450(-)
MPHFVAKLWVFALEFDGASSKTNYDSKHGAADDAEQDGREDDSDHEADQERHQYRMTDASQAMSVQGLQNDCKRSAKATNNKANHGKNVGNEIIGHEPGPSSLLKQLVRFMPCIFQPIMIKSNVRKSPGSE